MRNEIQFVQQMITDESVSGEFMISSGVQHAIVQLLLDPISHPQLHSGIDVAISIVMQALENAEVSWNGFLIEESVRGSIHGLTSLELSPEDAAKATIQGILCYLEDKAIDVEEFAHSIYLGVKHAAEDMGIKPWQILRMIAEIPLDGVWNQNLREDIRNSSDEEAELKRYLRDLSIKTRNNRLKN